MIFITIGSVFPFDRLIQSMDQWAADTGRGDECFAQLGEGAYKPKNMRWAQSLSHADYAKRVREANVIVSHAGMGSAITAMRQQVPIVMLPRRFEAGEHTTDHQMATARWLEAKPGVSIAWDTQDLGEKIRLAEASQGTEPALSQFAPQEFTDRLKQQLSDWCSPD